MKMHKIACAILSVWVLLGIAAGQTTSRMTGVVRDASGALVAGAEVTLTNDATGVAFHTRTTSAGTYVFDAVKPGVYSVQVVAKEEPRAERQVGLQAEPRDAGEPEPLAV